MAIDNKILIYSDKTSPRLDYVLNLICNDIWKVQWEVTHEIEVFNSSSVGVINYSNENTEKGISISPSSLLFEKGIQNQNIQVSFDEKLPLFYHGDILAMIFYMVSRYEEYLPFDMDNHGRFSASQSLAFKNGFLDKPIVVFVEKGTKALMRGEFTKVNHAALSHIVLCKNGTAKIEKTSHQRAVHEFPQFNARMRGLNARYLYTVGDSNENAPGQTSVLKHDLKTGKITGHNYGAHSISEEHLFIPRPGAVREDDGWLIGCTGDCFTPL